MSHRMFWAIWILTVAAFWAFFARNLLSVIQCLLITAPPTLILLRFYAKQRSWPRS